MENPYEVLFTIFKSHRILYYMANIKFNVFKHDQHIGTINWKTQNGLKLSTSVQMAWSPYLHKNGKTTYHMSNGILLINKWGWRTWYQLYMPTCKIYTCSLCFRKHHIMAITCHHFSTFLFYRTFWCLLKLCIMYIWSESCFPYSKIVKQVKW